MSSFFGRRFIKLLEQDEVEDANMTDVEAMETQLEPGTSADEFGVDAPEQSADDLIQANNSAQSKELQSWVAEMDRFVHYLNGEGDSIQSKLHKASCDTLFDKIASAETKKIARVAMDLSSLVQNFKGYLHTATDS
jgi:hypothetical protein